MAFELAFERFRDRYHQMLERCLHHRSCIPVGLCRRSAWARSCCWCRGWDRISFPRSTPDNSSCTCERGPARGSKRRRICATGSKASSANRFRPAKFPASSTTSAALQQHQPLLQQLGADRPGRRRHSGHSEPGPSADRRIRPRFAPEAGANNFRAWIFPFCRPTSSARF